MSCKFIIAEDWRQAGRYAKEQNWQRSEWTCIVSGMGATWYKLKGHHLKPEDVIILSYAPPELQRLIEDRMR